jgi:hypothetical protein
MKMKSIKIMLSGILTVPLMFVGAMLLAPVSTFATPPPCTSDVTITNGANCTQSSTSTSPTSLFDSGGVFQTVVNIALFIIGAVAVIMLIYGGIRYTISGGDSAAVTAAKNTILYAIVGIVVAILAYAIVNFVIGGLVTPTTPTT